MLVNIVKPIEPNLKIVGEIECKGSSIILVFSFFRQNGGCVEWNQVIIAFFPLVQSVKKRFWEPQS